MTEKIFTIIEMETTELSLIATFDELRRCADVLTDGTAEVGKDTQFTWI